MVGIVIGLALIALAAWILARRLARFVRTKGRSGCEGCPYAGGCRGKGCERKENF